MNNSVKVKRFEVVPDQGIVLVKMEVVVLGVTIDVPQIPISEQTLDQFALNNGRVNGQWTNEDVRLVVAQYFSLLSNNVSI